MDSLNEELLSMYDNNHQELSLEMELNLYITLLTLSNFEYKEQFYLDESEQLENFLRKVNNLKVKIQLGRKQNEIDDLLNEIKELYDKDINLIKRYNKESLAISSLIDSKEPTNITKVVDKLTKEKMKIVSNKAYYDKLRKTISNTINLYDYHIEDDKLFINIPDNPNFFVTMHEFRQIFSYLLNIENYNQPFLTSKANRMHTILVANIIKLLVSREVSDNNLLIPLTLTYIVSKNRCFDEKVDASKFKINNIKITDLYSLTNMDNNVDIDKCSKWQKIVIPNTYLYKRLCDIVLKGMYYFDDNNFIMEDIKDNISDFKISISTNDIKELLKKILNSLTNKTVYSM